MGVFKMFKKSFLQKKTEQVITANALSLESSNSKEEIEIAEQTLISLKNDHGYFSNLSDKEISVIVKGVSIKSKNITLEEKIKNKIKSGDVNIKYFPDSDKYIITTRYGSIYIEQARGSTNIEIYTHKQYGPSIKFFSESILRLAEKVYLKNNYDELSKVI